jgi:hypothetical protein
MLENYMRSRPPDRRSRRDERQGKAAWAIGFFGYIYWGLSETLVALVH